MNKYIHKAVKRVEVVRYGKPTTFLSSYTALTELGERYLKRRYPNTKNDVICEKLGVTMPTLMRMAKARGYKKSKAYRRALGKNASIEAEKWYNSLSAEEREAYDEMRRNALIKAGEPHRFGTDLGNKHLQKVHKRRAKWEPKRKEAFYKTFHKDKARCLFGLDQKSKFKFRFTEDHVRYHNTTCMRSRLRGNGCTIARGSFAVYNHEGVSELQRENAQKMGFIFKN